MMHIRYFMSILVLQSSQWGRESRLICLVVILVFRNCYVVLPGGVMGVAAVCVCGIS